MKAARRDEPRWLVLFHQIPPEPAYLRVKVGRRLAKIGAIGLKNAVYVLPRRDGAVEDMQWILREVVGGGGDATLCEASFVEGLGDDDVRQRFRDARDADYEGVSAEARRIGKGLPARLAPDDDRRSRLEADVVRLEQRLEEIANIDFFEAPGRREAAALVAAQRRRLERKDDSAPSDAKGLGRDALCGKVWVTRTGVHVDRIASAWLVRRFVDSGAEFKFVAPKGYVPGPGEVRFDMYDAEFTHEGDRCTFEVLAGRLSIHEPGVDALAEVVHDIDLKESKFGRPEVAGVAAAIIGLCTLHREDDARLEAGFALFDQLRAHFARKRA